MNLTRNTHQAHKTNSAFRMSCSVSRDIRATPEKVWSLLTNAARFPEWNTTVTRIGGTIALGERLAIQVPVAPKRTFKPRVVAFTPNREMQWSDGVMPMFRGVRTFTLTPQDEGITTFTITEVFTGVMLPMIKGSLPDFGPVFETYAADLTRAAEAKS